MEAIECFKKLITQPSVDVNDHPIVRVLTFDFFLCANLGILTGNRKAR
jgi:hypothetical protein